MSDDCLSESVGDVDFDYTYLRNVEFVNTPPEPYKIKNTYRNIEEIGLEPEKGCTDCCSNANSFCLALISSIITVAFILIVIIVSSAKKSKHPLIIVSRSIPIVHEIGSYILWGLHCGALIALPWLLIFLYKNTESWYIFFAPAMMAFNMAGGFFPIYYSFIPLIAELVLVSIILYKFPFKTAYSMRKGEAAAYFQGESTLMALGVIFISASLGVSTCSYIIFAPHLRIDGINTFYPNPYYSIDYLNALYNTKEIKQVTGGYLSCYSLFMFLSVTYGFIMSFRNSLLMAIPFIILVISTILTARTLGFVLFGQLVIHVIYTIFLQFEKTRKFVSGFYCRKKAKCFIEGCNATANMILIGDILSFTFVVFPIVGILNGNYQTKFPLGFYFGGTIFLMLGVLFHLFILYSSDREKLIISLIFSPVCIAIGTSLIGVYFRGYVPFIRSFTFVITCLSWSIMLALFGRMNGFSPILFKTYHVLIPAASLVVIIMYEGFGILEVLFCVVQIFFNSYLITLIQYFKKMEIAWAFLFVGGIAVFGLPGAVIAVAFFLILYLLRYIDCLKDFMETIGFEESPINMVKKLMKDDLDKEKGKCQGELWAKKI